MLEKGQYIRIAITGSSQGYQDVNSHKNVGNFTTYHIRTELPDGSTTDTRRRYSEFEILHGHLLRKHPTCIIPPIPEKHSFIETVVMLTSIVKKEDVKSVDKRKRLLASFLNNVALSKRLKDDRIFELFLKDSHQWSEETLREADGCLNAVIPLTGSLEQIVAKYNGIIDGRLTDLHRTFVDMEKALISLEDAETKRYVYEALCDLGCSYNAFSLEYESESEFSKRLALTGECTDADAALLHQSISITEAYCDKLYEQRQFCLEANRLIIHVASCAVRCDSLMKSLSAKRAHLLSLENSGDKIAIDSCEESIRTMDREKASVESEYSRVLTEGTEEVHRLKLDLMANLSEILKTECASLIEYHHNNAIIYNK